MKNYIKSFFLLCLLLVGTALRAQVTVVDPSTGTAAPPTTGGPCPDINISTGIDNAGNAIPVGAPDPNWVITAGPGGAATPKRVMSWIPNWQATPIAGTNACWINQTGNITGNLNGIYKFTRTFTVAPGTVSFTTNFGVGGDDLVVGCNLITPSATVIPLAVPPTPVGMVSAPIGHTEVAPAVGVWKIELIVRIVDGRGAGIVSGYIDFNCNDNPCNCENIYPTFTYTINEADCIATFVAQINSNCQGVPVQYTWYVNGSPVGSGPTWSYAFPGNGTYTVCLVVTLTTADGQTCVREYCKQVTVDCDPCSCDLLIPDFTYTVDKCEGYFTGASDVPCCMTDVIYDWYVNGNPVGSGANFTYTFPANGFYNVCAFVTTTLPDGTQCHKQICKLVEIKDCSPCNCEQLQVGFQYQMIDPCTAVFFANASGPDCMSDYTYQWYVNGSPAGTGPNLTYTFPTNGIYNICVFVTVTLPDGTQCHKEYCKIIEVKDCDPCNCDQLQVAFDYWLDDCVGHFFGYASGPECMSNYTYQWFVNGMPAGSGPNLTYTFPGNGVYQVCLFVTVTLPDGTQCHKEFCRFIEVKDCDPCNCEQLQIGFDYGIELCEGHFDGWAVVPPCMTNVTYQWYVNGSPVGSGPTLGYAFPGNGIYTVCLYVTATLPNGQICQKEVCQEVEVKDCPPCNCEQVGISYTYQLNGCIGYFYSNASIPTCASSFNYQWYVNGAPAGTGPNLTYSFPGNGTYTVCVILTVTLPNGEVCQREYCRQVKVTNCQPCSCDQVSVSYNYHVENCTGYFDAILSMPPCLTTAPSFQWYVNGSPAGSGPNLTYSFPGSGVYYVCVVVTVNINGQICQREYCRYIEVDCPCNCEMLTGNYSVQVNGCVVKLKALPQVPPCMQGVSFTWTVNGAYIGSSPTISWIAPTNGIYTICLTISALLPNGQKCERIICKNVKVNNCGIIIGPAGMAPESSPTMTLEESVVLYPNPASDVININFTTQEDGPVLITFKTTDGKVVLEQTKETVAGEQHFELRIPDSIVDEMIFVELTTTTETITRKVSVSKR